MTDTRFTLRSIPHDEADALRKAGGDVSIAGEFPGFPCRQCLQDAEVGEELILVSHDPFIGSSPYRSASPIFLHRHTSTPPAEDRALPEQLTRRQLSVRASDSDQLMIDAVVIEGSDLDLTLQRFFDNIDINQVHVHNASRGCWAVSAERAKS